ncbi:hypothetical protein BCV09_07210 [Vibrio cyclitrophicus]|uniref:lipase family protein n=1 Tax=Vibrio cyclitrophicus TaxID=47951 RepID=UPI000CC9BD2B|nr:hypothetical protein [Vibrio cyclitrophicus]PMF59939.1 hypothetical protein BCV09_03765 [Vibrio cyclitrophicus]
MKKKVVFVVVLILLALFSTNYLFVVGPERVVEEFKKQQSSLNQSQKDDGAKVFLDNLASYLLYARASDSVYSQDSQRELEEIFPMYDFSISSYEKGCLKIAVGFNHKSKKTLVIFRGTVPMCPSNWIANFTHGAFGNSKLYENARRFIEAEVMRQEYSGYSVVFVGHSLGGSLAINNGVYFGNSDVYTFNTAFPNSFGVDAAQLNKYMKIREKNVARSTVTNFVVEGDEVAGKSLSKFHGLIGNTYMLSHSDIPARQSLDHSISEVIYKLEVVSQRTPEEINNFGRDSYVGEKMTF